MASSEIKPRSTITESFRVENAKKFIQAFRSRPYPNDFGIDNAQYENQWASILDNNQDVFYMSIGRIVPWVYSEGIDSDIPEPNSTWTDLTSIWTSMLSIKRVQPTNVIHVIPRENWKSDNQSYPFYRSDAINTTTYDDPESENFYVLDENEFRVYKCIWNNYGVWSAYRPITIGEADVSKKTQAEPFATPDGYIWKYMYTIEPFETLNFVTDNYIPARADRENADNSSVDGAIYKIAITGKQVSDIEDDPRDDAYATPSGGDFARIKVDDLHSDSGNVTDDNGLIQINIDLTNENNSERMATAETDDMVGYQVEHVIDREGERRIEIGRIVSSTVDFVDDDRQNVILQVERLDNEEETMFTVVENAEEERWFISPYVQIYGDGKEATAMVLNESESKSVAYNTDFREFFPENDVEISGVVDIHMNTYGNGYRNIYYRDVDNEEHSLVVIRKGRADIGEGLSEESPLVPEEDRKIQDFAHIVSITPLGGHSFDNVMELYAWNVMINQTFQSNEDSFANIVNDFRQVALIQNPITQDNTIASDQIFRQTLRIEFDGDLTQGEDAIQLDDEISDTDDRNEMRRVFGYVSNWEVVDDNGETKTQVYLSSTFGFLERSAEEIYELNDNNEMFITFRGETGEELSGEDAIVLNLSDRIIDDTSDGYLQKELGSSDESLQLFSGQMMYIENRLPISRSEDQSENIKLVIEY